MTDASMDVNEGSPSRKRKRHQHIRKHDSTRQSSLAWKQCHSSAVDIEDLYGRRCQLLCAPVLPSQSAEEYPLADCVDVAAAEEAATRAGGEQASSSSSSSSAFPLRIPGRRMAFTCTDARGRSPGRRDSEFQLNGKIIANPHPPEARDCLPSVFSTLSALASTLAPRQTTQFDAESRSQCLLERVNPEYFAQDKYKWHSSMAQGPDTSEMMLIDPESAQDFTALYTSDNNISDQDMSQYTLPDSTAMNNAGNMAEANVPDLDGASSPSKSAYSSPDSMLQPLPSFDRQTSDATSNDAEAFEDVNQMFDWDGACASLVDDYIPDYKHAGPIMPRYNTSLFRSIPTISARSPYGMGGPSNSTIYHASHRMIESSRASHAHMQQTMASQHADEDDGTGTVCHNCGVTKTPLWRRTPDKRHSLCNACGLYLKQYKTMRPLVPRNRSHVPKKDEENTVCSNCEATKTSLWRKDEGGQVICNACGLYFKLHNKARPVAMRKEKISRRKRYRNLATETIDIHDPIPLTPQQSSPVVPDLQAASVQDESLVTPA